MEHRPANEASGDTSTHEASNRRKSSIPEPEPAHFQSDSEDDDREATELRSTPRLSHILPSERAQREQHWYSPLEIFWRHHIRLSVPHVDCRDHLGRHNHRTLT